MMKKSFLPLVMLFLLLSMLAACQAATPGATAEPSALPAVTSVATTPSRQYLSLGSVITSQSGKAPDYTIKVEIPVMNGSLDPHVVAFNQAVAQVAQKEIDAFKKNLQDMSVTPVSAGSSFELKYVPVSQRAHIVSLQFKIYQYMDGAAHPFDYTVAFNYDLDQDSEISLGQLFVPGTDYLQSISAYCKAELGKRDIGFDAQQQGADPTAENYHNWNISTDGLLITFDEYQVAPYAAGPQAVVVPYDVLKDMIDPQGPLAEFKR